MMFLHHTYTTSEKFGPTFSCSFFSLSLQLSAVQIDTEDVTVHNIHKLPTCHGAQNKSLSRVGGRVGGGGARFPFQSCYETRPAGKQQCARRRFIIRFFEGPVVRERASSREPLPDLSTFAVRFFFFLREGLSHWGKI